MFQGLKNISKKRYEIHQAFHQDIANKWTHFLSTPLQLFGIIKLFALCSLPLFWGASLNMGILLILILSIVYCLIHFKTGLIVSLYLIVCWCIASYYPFSTQWYLEALFAIAIFLFGAFVQVGLGHKIFERKNANLSSEFEEFFQTYNPMIFVLIFFFPFLDFLKMTSRYRKRTY